MKKLIFTFTILGAALTGCHNSDIDHPDFDYQRIYFATQTPIRVITLGDEKFVDNTNDNNHCFEVFATLGGVNENRSERSASFAIDPTLCDGIAFEDGRDIVPLPQSHYVINTGGLSIAKGDVMGSFKVELTDAFFADPKAYELNYVLPVVLTSGSEPILTGTAKEDVASPYRLNREHWSVLPKDYVLYGLKFKNAYDGCWLSKGTDIVTVNGVQSTIDRQAQYWEKASLRYLRTRGLSKSAYGFTHNVTVKDAAGNNTDMFLNIELLLDIDAQGNVTVSTDTPGCSASGNGTWTSLGEKKAFADADRDLLKLNYTYTIDYVADAATGAVATYKVQTDEQMVLRDRENKFEEFKFILK